MQITKEKIHDLLYTAGYCSNNKIDCAVLASLITEKPLLLEGAPGVGKTSLAKAVAEGLDLPFLRVQMYDGLTDDSILYDYDYQKQLLVLEAIKPQLEKEYGDLSAKNAMKKVAKDLDFYGEDFLLPRPILKSITGKKRCVLLIDEIDKAPEEIEYMLYEFLENYSITIPQYKEIICNEKTRPIVFLTSNSYRDLSDALKRRCNYLYIPEKSEKEMYDILIAKTNKGNESLCMGVAKCFTKMQKQNLYKQPSISEGIEFTKYLEAGENLTKDDVIDALSFLAKDRRDEATIKRIFTEDGALLWEG